MEWKFKIQYSSDVRDRHMSNILSFHFRFDWDMRGNYPCDRPHQITFLVKDKFSFYEKLTYSWFYQDFNVFALSTLTLNAALWDVLTISSCLAQEYMTRKMRRVFTEPLFECKQEIILFAKWTFFLQNEHLWNSECDLKQILIQWTKLYYSSIMSTTLLSRRIIKTLPMKRSPVTSTTG